ncbi:MAG TPA: ParB N-terminal domain-containing protein [bacterium]|nr:ParB N-terminal domain-containing protein [bacterium]
MNLIDRIVVDSAVKDVLPQLSESEIQKLRCQLKKDGLTSKIVVEKNGDNFKVIDGMHRIDICREEGIPVTIDDLHVKSFENQDQLKLWIIQNQMGRRNLEPWQRCDIGVIIEVNHLEYFKKQTMLSLNINEGWDTQKFISKFVNVSSTTYSRYRRIYLENNQELKCIKSGDESISSVYSRLYEKKQSANISRKTKTQNNGKWLLINDSKTLIEKIREDDSIKTIVPIVAFDMPSKIAYFVYTDYIYKAPSLIRCAVMEMEIKASEIYNSHIASLNDSEKDDSSSPIVSQDDTLASQESVSI